MNTLLAWLTDTIHAMSEANPMADQFLHLPGIEQGAILHSMSTRIGRAPPALDRDVWVVCVLIALLEIQIAFKGSTA